MTSLDLVSSALQGAGSHLARESRNSAQVFHPIRYTRNISHFHAPKVTHITFAFDPQAPAGPPLVKSHDRVVIRGWSSLLTLTQENLVFKI